MVLTVFEWRIRGRKEGGVFLFPISLSRANESRHPMAFHQSLPRKGKMSKEKLRLLTLTRNFSMTASM